MAKLSKEEVEQIIERDLPDFQVVKESIEKDTDNTDFGRFRDSARQRSISDATSPSLDTLREKLRQRSGRSQSDSTTLGSYRNEGFRSDDVGDVDNETADDTIVAVRPKTSHSPYDGGYRTKAVIISGRQKKVIGRQG
ncbi:MAG TPA: hypothetical protein VJM50_20975 [Pyrinomonadaceae bacterium]|nr:hypothetical protein [Pyrinomonadaceae bacterium]